MTKDEEKYKPFMAFTKLHDLYTFMVENREEHSDWLFDFKSVILKK